MFNSGLNYSSIGAKQGLLAGLKKFNWTGLLNGTQKTLNIVNQAIPLIYQVRPIINNAKTVFKVIGAVRGDNTSKSYTQNTSNASTINKTNNNYINTSNTIHSVNSSNNSNPIFFL